MNIRNIKQKYKVCLFQKIFKDINIPVTSDVK